MATIFAGPATYFIQDQMPRDVGYYEEPGASAYEDWIDLNAFTYDAGSPLAQVDKTGPLNVGAAKPLILTFPGTAMSLNPDEILVGIQFEFDGWNNGLNFWDPASPAPSQDKWEIRLQSASSLGRGLGMTPQRFALPTNQGGGSVFLGADDELFGMNYDELADALRGGGVQLRLYSPRWDGGQATGEFQYNTIKMTVWKRQYTLLDPPVLTGLKIGRVQQDRYSALNEDMPTGNEGWIGSLAYNFNDQRLMTLDPAGAVIHVTRVCNAWNTLNRYRLGDCVTRPDGKIWQCTATVVEPSAGWDTAEWRELYIQPDIPPWRTDWEYTTDQLVAYSGGIYKCLVAASTVGTFESAEWETIIPADLSTELDDLQAQIDTHTLNIANNTARSTNNETRLDTLEGSSGTYVLQSVGIMAQLQCSGNGTVGGTLGVTGMLTAIAGLTGTAVVDTYSPLDKYSIDGGTF